MVTVSSLGALWHLKHHSCSFVSILEWFKTFFKNQNSHHEKPLFSFTQLNQPWATKNEPKMGPLQKWTCLSVFELSLRFLSSEHSKHIQKNLWLRIFNLVHEFFEKIIFVPQYFHKWAFCKEILTKISFGAPKNFSSDFFFDFLKMILGSIYGHCKFPRCFVTSQTSFVFICKHFGVI